MSQYIRNELKTSFASIRFWTPVLVFILSSVSNYIFNQMRLPGLPMSGTLNVFLFSVQFGRNILSYTLPFIAVLPYSLSIWYDIRTGYVKQAIIRLGDKDYIVSKIIVSTILCATLVLICNAAILLLSFCVSPMPSYRIYSLDPNSVFGRQYEMSMILFVLLYMINTIVFCSLYSLFGLSIAPIIKNKYISITIPAIFYIVGTLNHGSLLGINILPFSTFILHSTTLSGLIKDYSVLLGLSAVLFLIGIKKWKKAGA